MSAGLLIFACFLLLLVALLAFVAGVALTAAAEAARREREKKKEQRPPQVELPDQLLVERVEGCELINFTTIDAGRVRCVLLSPDAARGVAERLARAAADACGGLNQASAVAGSA